MCSQWGRFLVVGVFLSLLLAASGAIAHDYVIDQEAVTPFFGVAVSLREGPQGQSFVPQLSALDVVEVWLSNGDLLRPYDVSVAVQIRSHPGGAILGTSSEVIVVHPTTRGVHHFDFATPVPLVPETQYILEVFMAAPSEGNVGIHGTNDVYPNGQRFATDVFDPFTDQLFREGLSSPVPVEPATWGRVKAFYR